VCLKGCIASARIVDSIHVHTHTHTHTLQCNREVGGGGVRLCLLVAAMPAFVRSFVRSFFGFALLYSSRVATINHWKTSAVLRPGP